MYIVFGGEYSDWYMIGYFEKEEDAQKYCKCDKNKDFGYYVEHSDKLSISEGLKAKKLFRLQHITFNYTDDGKFEMREHGYHDYSLQEYTKEDEKQVYQKMGRTRWISYEIASNDRAKAEKIAQDRMTKLMYEMVQTNMKSAAKLLGYTNHQDRYK